MKLHEITKPRFLTDKVEIEAWLEEAGIENYTIHPDGVVDIDGNVNLYDKKLTFIPIQFGKVSSFFSCSYNKLTSFEGCPSKIGGTFYCTNNKITSLEGISDIIQEINGEFYCNGNNIQSGGLGLLLIKGLKNINSGNPALKIIEKYLGKDDIFGCQEELIDNGFEAFTKL